MKKDKVDVKRINIPENCYSLADFIDFLISVQNEEDLKDYKKIWFNEENFKRISLSCFRMETDEEERERETREKLLSDIRKSSEIQELKRLAQKHNFEIVEK